MWRASATWPTIGGRLSPRHEAIFSMAPGPRSPGLTVRDLADYVAWLHERPLGPTSIARHIASLKVFFRYLQLEGVLVESQAELLGSQKLWERVPKVLTPAQVAGFRDAQAGRPMLAAGPGFVGAAVRHWLPGVGTIELEAADLHLDGLLHMPRQRRQGTNGAAGRTGGRAVTAYLHNSDRRHADGEQGMLAARPPWVLLSYRGRRLRRERIWELLKRYAFRLVLHRRLVPIPCDTASPPTCWPAARFAAGARDARPRQHRHHPDLHPRRLRTAEGRPPEVPSTRVGPSCREDNCRFDFERTSSPRNNPFPASPFRQNGPTSRYFFRTPSSFFSISSTPR